MNWRELFDYDPETGVLMWKVSRTNRIKIGQVAGSITTNHKGKPYENKYLHVSIVGKFTYVHRIIWELMTGEPIPKDVHIDHRNGHGLDNRWGNLRLCSRAQNMANRRSTRSRFRQLPKGVRWHNRDNAYVAVLAGKFVKQSKSLQVVKAAYDEAIRDRYGEFARSD